MVEGLSKRITGDWVEAGQAGLSPNALVSYFAYTPAALDAIAAKLTSAVLQGVTEYKEGVLHPLFHALEEMKFKSIAFEELERQQDEVGRLLFVTLFQRLFALGGISSPAGAAAGPARAAAEDLKLILADVMARVREQPALKNEMAVKMILTQLAIYQRERETMEKLLPNIKGGEKAAAFRRNFGNTFQKISANIRKYYGEFLETEQRRVRRRERLVLAQLNLHGAVALFTKQAREFLRIRSTLAFAREGKYKVREICVHLFNEKSAVFGLLDEETAAYRKLAPAAYGEHAVSLAWAAEIAAALEKLSGRLKEGAGAAEGPVS